MVLPGIMIRRRAEHFEYMAKLRDKLYQKANYTRAWSSSSNIFSYIGNTVICNYLDAWVGDIDRGLTGYIQTSENIAKGTITAGEGDLAVIKNELGTWLDQSGKYMSPIPDIIVNVLGAPESFLKFLKEQSAWIFSMICMKIQGFYRENDSRLMIMM